MKTISSLLLVSILVGSCNYFKSQGLHSSSLNHKNKIMVVAHRGDWRNAPENSLKAIQNCIDMEIDMVEIDLKMTKDSVLIVMHDKTLERTTTGNGLVKEIRFDSISKLYLKNGQGMPTHHKIPQLVDALKMCKDKILVFLDKGYKYMPKVMAIVKDLKMEDQVFFEGKAFYKDLKKNYSHLDEVNYMPRVNPNLSDKNYLSPYLGLKKPPIFILSFNSDAINDMKKVIDSIKFQNGKVMLVTLWPNTCGGYTDDLAVYSPEKNWGEAIKLGADLICTDRPQLLLGYLRKNKQHD